MADDFDFKEYAAAHIRKASLDFSRMSDFGEYEAYLDADFSQLADIVKSITECGKNTILKPSVIYLEYEWGTLKIYPKR